MIPIEEVRLLYFEVLICDQFCFCQQNPKAYEVHLHENSKSLTVRQKVFSI